MKKHFPIIVEQDRNGAFIVECPIFKGCRSYGNTMEEAIDNIREAIQVCQMDESSEATDTVKFVGVRDLELAV